MVFLFHSPAFILCVSLVLVCYWVLPHRFRNRLLLAASYGFYCSWDWRFLSLIIVSTFVDYNCGLGIHRAKKKSTRKALLLVSLGVNLSLLCFFKYFDFFIESMVALCGAFGFDPGLPTLNIVLPLGISFYTFQTLSYTIDIYRGKIEPTRSWIDFSLYVAYFPQLIAGPIEKARDLLPQIQAVKEWRQVQLREGIYLFVYGAFKKVVLADSLGRVVNEIFNTPEASGAQVLIGLWAFAIQLYCDFSGYSNMARGVSHLFGIRLSVNFDLPFFSKSYFEFFRRWHITLSAWIAEYVYMPLYFHIPTLSWVRRLGGVRVQLLFAATLALLVTRLIFAIWHGASINFLLLGVFIYVTQLLTVGFRLLLHRVPETVRPPLRWAGNALRVLLMFHIFCYAMLLFRSHDLQQIVTFTIALFTDLDIPALVVARYWYLYVIMVLLAFYEALQYRRVDQLFICRAGFYTQMVFYLVLIFLYIQIGAIADHRFLYFQF